MAAGPSPGRRRLSGRDEVLPFFFSNPSVAVDSKRGWIYAAYTRGGRDAVWDLVIAGVQGQGQDLEADADRR